MTDNQENLAAEVLSSTQINTMINYHEQLGFLLPGWFKVEPDVLMLTPSSREPIHQHDSETTSPTNEPKKREGE